METVSANNARARYRGSTNVCMGRSAAATLGSGALADARQLAGQRDKGASVVDARQAPLVGRQTADVVHLEQELARPVGVARILPRQLQQPEVVGCPRVLRDEIAVEMRADLGVSQIGLARRHEETRAAELADRLEQMRMPFD